jgi:hypothetical protein
MTGKHKSRDGSTMTYVGSSDTVGGNVQQTGYCYNTSQPGRELWDVEAKVSTSDRSMKVLGKWHLSGGAGTLAKVSGAETSARRRWDAAKTGSPSLHQFAWKLTPTPSNAETTQCLFYVHYGRLFDLHVHAMPDEKK